MTASHTVQTSNTFDLASLLLFFWQKKYRIALTALILMAVGFNFILQQPKVYRSTAILMLGDSSHTLPLSTVAALSGNSSSKMDTNIEVIKSRQFLRSVVLSLDLHLHPEFAKDQSLDEDKRIAEATEALRKQLSLSIIKNTDMLKVSFEAHDPVLSSEVVNTIGPQFFSYKSVQNRDKAVNATKWLNSQLDEIKLALSKSEAALERFLKENNLVDINSQIRLVQAAINTLMKEQLALEKQFSSIDSTYQQVIAFEGDREKLMGISWIMNNDLIVDLRRRISGARQELAQISKRYKHKHHRYIAVHSALTKLEEELALLLSQIVEGVKKEHAQAVRRMKQLDAQLQEAQTKHSEFGRLEIELTRLKREIESNQKLYEAFLSRLQEMEVVKDLTDNENFSIVDYGRVPESPFKPNIPLGFALVTIMSGIFSAGMWFLIHLVKDRRSRFVNILNHLGVPILAQIPKLSANKHAKNLSEKVRAKQKNFLFAEAIRSVRTAIMLKAEQKEHRVIAVTSLGKSDGKSSLSISLAESFVRLEKTLLIDADLRSPSLSTAYAISEAKAGLNDLITKRAKYSQCAHVDKHTQLHILGAGILPQDPVETLTKSRFVRILGQLGILYERVIIDVPPLEDCSDALVISKYVDGMILVCDTDMHDSEALVDAIARLRDINAPLLGVVFNRVRSLSKKTPHESHMRYISRRVLSLGRA